MAEKNKDAKKFKQNDRKTRKLDNYQPPKHNVKAISSKPRIT